MRIIGGIAHGILLQSLSGQHTRPTLGRVRESIFSSLGDLRGQVIADLFAGSGGLGLEALSRGAKEVVFVENNRRALGVLRNNVERVSSFFRNCEGSGPEVDIIRGNAFRIARLRPGMAGRVDVVFADPPYTTKSGATELRGLLQDSEFASWLGSGLLVLEHDKNTSMPWYPATSWRLLKARRFGNCKVSFAVLSMR